MSIFPDKDNRPHVRSGREIRQSFEREVEELAAGVDDVGGESLRLLGEYVLALQSLRDQEKIGKKMEEIIEHLARSENRSLIVQIAEITILNLGGVDISEPNKSPFLIPF